MNNIRNFAIIAHVDHGKSTLADRLMELTGTVEAGAHADQMLDRNPISRERGITIKLAPVRMRLQETRDKRQVVSVQPITSHQSLTSSNSGYILNLIDTPGHVDFSYEVDRTLSCVEGVILLVDATQGIQAQTIANAYKAIEKDLIIIPVINKIDLPSADVSGTKEAMVELLGVEDHSILEISAKTGEGVNKILEQIVTDIPAPQEKEMFHSPSAFQNDTLHINQSVQALIFDSYFDEHRGVVAFVRVTSGTVKKGQKLLLFQGNTQFESSEVGIFTPDLTETETLSAGEIGYIVTNLKDIHKVRVGDTITDIKHPVALSGYHTVQPMVFATLFPTDPDQYTNLRKALEKLYLTDSALTFSSVYSKALGSGFRTGFLGLLHADVVRERLEREFNLDLVLTTPQVDYREVNGTYQEPIVRLRIVTPPNYLSSVMRLTEQHRGIFVTMDNKHQVYLEYEMPLSEMISDYFDALKSVSSGYASFDWEFIRYEPVEASKMELLLNGEAVEEFSEIVTSARAYEKARNLAEKLRKLIPRQQYEVRIQARYKGKIIASERIAPYRKDVLIKSGKVVGAGDVGRKKKLLEKQKEGKKKMKMIGRVEIPKEAFTALLKK
jgi:GTP-binding protein LepA